MRPELVDHSLLERLSEGRPVRVVRKVGAAQCGLSWAGTQIERFAVRAAPVVPRAGSAVEGPVLNVSMCQSPLGARAVRTLVDHLQPLFRPRFLNDRLPECLARHHVIPSFSRTFVRSSSASTSSHATGKKIINKIETVATLAIVPSTKSGAQRAHT